jgi:hypothetical protein
MNKIRTHALLPILALLAAAGTATAPTVAKADPLISLNAPVTCVGLYSSQFACSFVDDGVLDNYSYTGYWLSNQGAGSSVTLNLGATFAISSIALQDTHNNGWFDRGTQAFTIAGSTDGTHFTDLLTGTISNSAWQNDTIVTYSLSASEQYVRFTANSIYGLTAGLAELSVYGTPAPEPATVALLGVGVAALGAIRRRRA